MESENCTARINNLDHLNYHFWKLRIEHSFDSKGIGKFPTWRSTKEWSFSHSFFMPHKGQKISSNHWPRTLQRLPGERPRCRNNTGDMGCIRNVFERHNLQKKLSARKRCYTSCMNTDESVPKFANRIRQLAATLKSARYALWGEVSLRLIFRWPMSSTAE